MLVSHSVFAAKFPPTDADLHTAYCIAVLQWSVKLQNDMLPGVSNPTNDPKSAEDIAGMRNDHADSQSALDRLNAYLMPKMTSLDMLPIAMATKRAQADIRELSAAVDQCNDKCSPLLSGGLKASHSCHADCMKSNGNTDGQGAVGRIQACMHPTWLPF